VKLVCEESKHYFLLKTPLGKITTHTRELLKHRESIEHLLIHRDKVLFRKEEHPQQKQIFIPDDLSRTKIL